MSQADVLDAAATWLSGEMGVPVYYPSLPRSLVSAKPQGRKLVITPEGSMGSVGDRSWVKLTRAMAGLHCYGETEYQAMRVYREVAALLKGLTARTVNVGPSGEEVGVRIYNAVLNNGPVTIVDGDTQEQVIYGSWGVIGHEMEIGAAEPMSNNPQYIVKDGDEVFDTEVFSNVDGLSFSVEAGRKYFGVVELLVRADDDGAASFDFDSPVGVVLRGGVRSPGNDSVRTPFLDTGSELIGLDLGDVAPLLYSQMFIDFTVEAAAEGLVTLRARMPVGSPGPSIEIRDLSRIVLYTVPVT